MNQTILQIGIAFVGGCLVGIGAVKGVEIMAKKYGKRKVDDVYFYESTDTEEEVVDAIISENKLADFLEAIIEITVTDPTIRIEKLANGLTRVIFEASYDEHLEILKKAGIEYRIEEA